MAHGGRKKFDSNAVGPPGSDMVRRTVAGQGDTPVQWDWAALVTTQGVGLCLFPHLCREIWSLNSCDKAGLGLGRGAAWGPSPLPAPWPPGCPSRGRVQPCWGRAVLTSPR